MDVGRLRHSEWNKLGFKAQTVTKKDGKKVTVAFCLQCEKSVTNTAVARLRSHRKVCKLDISKLKECNGNLSTTSAVTIDDDDILNESEKVSHGTKRKATSSLSRNINESVKDDSMVDNNICSVTMDEKRDDFIAKNSNKRKTDKHLSNFLDQIDDLEKAKIDEALLELFIVFDIELENVNSRYLKKLLQLLRPAYASRLPKIEQLSNDILSQVYIKHVNNKTKFCSTGVLLINKQESLISLTFDKNGKYMFVKRQESSNEDFELFIEDSMKIVKHKYDTAVYAVVSNTNLSPVFIDQQETYYLTCISVKLQLLVESIIDSKLLDQVNLYC